MIYLGIDTSTSCGTLAMVYRQGGVIAEYSLNVDQTHSVRLLPLLDRMCKETGIGLDRLHRIAVTVGPGSFTGLRIGLTTAKALSLATGVPVVGIPTLDVLAENARYSSIPICAILDARKGELFAAMYRQAEQGSLKRVSDYCSIRPEALLDMIQDPVLLVGNGAPLYEKTFRRLGSIVAFAPEEYHYPRASVLCRLAMAKDAETGSTHPRDLKALYVRASDAELRRSC